MIHKRILIIEDQLSVRKALTDWFSHEYEVVNFESASDFLDAMASFDFEDGTPTAMLLDFQLVGMTGVDLQKTLREMNVEFPIVFMSGNAEKKDVIDAWRGGAVDFILKPFSGPEISKVVESVFQKIETHAHRNPRQPPSGALPNLPITPREAEVLLLLGKGQRQNEVAQLLNISLRTVKMYRAFIKQKLDLNTLVELTRFCDQYQDALQKLTNHPEGKRQAEGS